MRKPLITKIVNLGLICYLLAGIAAFATRPNLDRLYRNLYTTSSVKEYRGETSNYANRDAKQFEKLLMGFSQRKRCLTKLLKIGSAAEEYYAAVKEPLPPYIADPSGTPLHSWRVLLLPYLGEQKLYEQIKLDEPWDSEWNRQFHKLMPDCYCCPALSPSQREAGAACYQMLISKEEDGDKPKLTITETRPKFIERVPSVNWMDPSNEIPLAEITDEYLLNEKHSLHIDGGFCFLGNAIPGMKLQQACWANPNESEDYLRLVKQQLIEDWEFGRSLIKTRPDGESK